MVCCGHARTPRPSGSSQRPHTRARPRVSQNDSKHARVGKPGALAVGARHAPRSARRRGCWLLPRPAVHSGPRAAPPRRRPPAAAGWPNRRPPHLDSVQGLYDDGRAAAGQPPQHKGLERALRRAGGRHGRRGAHGARPAGSVTPRACTVRAQAAARGQQNATLLAPQVPPRGIAGLPIRYGQRRVRDGGRAPGGGGLRA